MVFYDTNWPVIGHYMAIESPFTPNMANLGDGRRRLIIG